MVWGVGLMMGDRAAEAAKVFQRGIDEKVLPDDNPAFYFYLAGALAMAERYDEALAAARTAAEKGKDSARFRGRPAWVLYVAKRYGEAIKAYRKLIDEFDADYTSTETRDVLREARMALSNLAVIRGDMPQAEEWLEQVLDEFPDDEGALNDLGYLWADQNKNLQRAQRMIRKALAGRAGQPGLSRQSRLGVVPPGEIPRSRRRVGEGRRRREARRHGPRPSRRRLSQGQPARQGRGGVAQGGRGLSEGEGNGKGGGRGEERCDMQIEEFEVQMRLRNFAFCTLHFAFEFMESYACQAIPIGRALNTKRPWLTPSAASCGAGWPRRSSSRPSTAAATRTQTSASATPSTTPKP